MVHIANDADFHDEFTHCTAGGGDNDNSDDVPTNESCCLVCIRSPSGFTHSPLLLPPAFVKPGH